MDKRTAGTGAQHVVDPNPTNDEIEVVFYDDPAPVVVRRRRPIVLTVLWVVALIAVAAVLGFLVREAVDTSPRGTEALEVGEFRSLTDDGAAVDLRCAETRPSAFGSPCLRDPETLARILDGRSSVVLVSNVASARHPDGAVRCLAVRARDDGASPVVRSIRCPEHRFVAAG